MPVDVGIQFNTFLQEVYGAGSGKDFGMSSDFTRASNTYRNDYITGQVDGRNLVNLPKIGYGGVPGSASPVIQAGGHPSYNEAYGSIVRGIKSNLDTEAITVDTARAQLNFISSEIRTGLTTGQLPLYYKDSQFPRLKDIGAGGLTNLQRITQNFFQDVQSRLPTGLAETSSPILAGKQPALAADEIVPGDNWLKFQQAVETPGGVSTPDQTARDPAGVDPTVPRDANAPADAATPLADQTANADPIATQPSETPRAPASDAVNVERMPSDAAASDGATLETTLGDVVKAGTADAASLGGGASDILSVGLRNDAAAVADDVGAASRLDRKSVV